MMISNMAAGNISIQLGLKGKCTNVVTACASGTNCIGDAFRAIQYGDAEVMLAGGAEGCICETGVAGFTSLTALSTSTDPMKASRPFDKDRNGFVLGEGAGVVVLEELEHAKTTWCSHLCRTCRIRFYRRCISHYFSGRRRKRCSKSNGTCDGRRRSRTFPGGSYYINAHGTSTHHNDLFETRAIKLALGDAAKDVVINSTKSMIGHLLGAAGGVEFITCVKTIQDNFIHQTVGTEDSG